MCGITGIFNVTGRPVSVNILKRMTEVLAHRGPDGEGYWTNSYIGFGHRRLAIIDLSPRGHQPMQNADGNLVITYNGEVYNFQSLRIELESKGYRFHSLTDSEVILKAFEEWGVDAIPKFNGMFAFAVWDSNKNQLVIARDRYGIKPIYYYFRSGIFLFASEIKSILQHPDVHKSVSVRALNEYFSFQNIFSDLTLFENVKLLPPAHFLTISLGEISSINQVQYWDYDFKDNYSLDFEEATEEVCRLFELAVNRQLVSDVEVGAYLSGGMDSGSITSIAARKFPNLKTFTCGFDLSSVSGLELGFDERERAELVSSKYKTEHYEVVLKAGDMERIMPQLIYHLEDLRVGQCYPNYYVSRLASKFVKVVLSGAGGDELFAGYPWRYYRASGNVDIEDYYNRYYAYWQRLIPDSLKKDFFQPDIYPEISNYPTREVFKSVLSGKGNSISSPAEYINLSLYFEIKSFMHGLLEVEDKLSMAHSLETRVPFLDNDLVDFATHIPVKFKLKNLEHATRLNENEPAPKVDKYIKQTNDGKLILRKALSHYVPEYYTNGVKQGFSAPDATWFKGESINYIKSLLFDPKASIYEYVQFQTATKLMSDHFTGQVNRRLLIWSFLCFEWWLRMFLK
jgi:asparagine synthase (glutamine-hydrolysing)